MLPTSPAPKDIDALLHLMAKQTAELEAERTARTTAEVALTQARAELTHRSLLIEKLKIQISRLRRMQFGRSSEKLRSELVQLEPMLEELETAEGEVKRNQRRQRSAPLDRPAADSLTICRVGRSCICRKPAPVRARNAGVC